MSDTPLTAKAKIACGFQAVPQSFLEHAENLERENDTLRKAYYKYESTLHDLRSVLDVTQLESFVQAAQRLRRENAALREALQNCAISASGQNWQQIAWIVEGALHRGKEAQP